METAWVELSIKAPTTIEINIRVSVFSSTMYYFTLPRRHTLGCGPTRSVAGNIYNSSVENSNKLVKSQSPEIDPPQNGCNIS